jgi:hypothetical protein
MNKPVLFCYDGSEGQVLKGASGLGGSPITELQIGKEDLSRFRIASPKLLGHREKPSSEK